MSDPQTEPLHERCLLLEAQYRALGERMGQLMQSNLTRSGKEIDAVFDEMHALYGELASVRAKLHELLQEDQG